MYTFLIYRINLLNDNKLVSIHSLKSNIKYSKLKQIIWLNFAGNKSCKLSN
jgi:hypothetical protein